MAPSNQRPADTLGMGEDEMRALGHQMVEMVIDHLVGRSDEKAIEVTDRASLDAAIGGDVPQLPSSAAEALVALRQHVIPKQQHGDHPRYFARVPSPAAFTGILGDWLGTGFNTIATSWVGGSGPAVTELIVIDWLRQLLRMPEGTQGIIVSGGSLANFTAFAAAFAEKGRGVVYLNDQTHSSLKRNLTAAGLDLGDIRVLPTNARQEYDLEQRDPARTREVRQDVQLESGHGTGRGGAAACTGSHHIPCRRDVRPGQVTISRAISSDGVGASG